MHVPFILVTLALLTAALIALRLRWGRLSFRTRKACVVTAITLIFVSGLSTVSKWSITWNTANTLLEWCRDLSYIFLVILFTRLRPRWLSVTVAVILIVPILSASILLPLGNVFNTAPVVDADLGGNVRSELIAFTNAGNNAGMDIGIYRQYRYMPFLRHRLFSMRYYDTQCESSRTSVQVDSRSVARKLIIRCPVAHSSDDNPDEIILFPVP